MHEKNVVLEELTLPQLMNIPHMVEPGKPVFFDVNQVLKVVKKNQQKIHIVFYRSEELKIEIADGPTIHFILSEKGAQLASYDRQNLHRSYEYDDQGRLICLNYDSTAQKVKRFTYLRDGSFIMEPSGFYCPDNETWP